MNALYHLVRADFLERVRRHGFLVTLALAAWLGYTVNAGQFALKLDHYRGVFNSAWIGGLMASVITTMLTLCGFYVVKNSVERDRLTRVGQILAATPMRRAQYTLAKALSNFLALSSMVAVLAAAAVAMQLIHGESARLEPWPLLSPFLLISLPAMAITAALAVCFEVVPVLRGSAGNAIYIGVWASSLSLALFTGWDMQGIKVLYTSMGDACRAVYPDYQGGFALGYSGDAPTRTFLWQGIHWTARMLLERAAWVGVAAGLALGCALFFDRFDPAGRSRGRFGEREGAEEAAGDGAQGMLAPGADALEASMSADLPAAAATGRLASTVALPVALSAAGAPAESRHGFRFGALLVAELRILLKGQPRWWQLVALGLVIAGAAMAPDTGRRTILVAAWIWPLAVWSGLGSRETRFGVGEMVFSSAHPLSRTLPAAWLAGFLVALAAGAGVGLRLALAGDAGGVLAYLAGAAFIPSLALALGTWSGTPRLFEAVYTLLWYIGPLNQVPQLDYMGAWKESVAAGVPWVCLALAPVLFLAALAGRRRRLLA